ncbi:hypothetical protein N8553_00830 [bacterium]|mgnify:FL=1|nr:hypothetical protein [bacterium]
MKLYLLKFFQFREKETAPYCVNGRGGNIFHGVGSHILWSHLNDRWYRFAFEVATQDQPESADLLKSRLVFTVGDEPQELQQSEIEWKPGNRRPTKDPNLSSYQWTQHVCIELQQPCIVTVAVEMLFSHCPDWLPVDGVGRILVDLHPYEPPKHYSYPMWHLRRWWANSPWTKRST